MSFLKRIIESLVRTLRSDPQYKLASDYSLIELILVLTYRGMQVFRGLGVKLIVKSKGIIFCGRSVVIEYGYRITAGQSLIIEDGVFINALSIKGITFGRNVSIGKGTIINCTGVISNKGVGLEVGNHTGIGAQSFIGCQGGIKIGSDVIIGPGLKMFSENHNFQSYEVPIRLQGEDRQGIVIGNNCWFGAGVTVLDGVSVGDGCVVAAGSLLNKSIPSNSIVAGVPAKFIKHRT